jgi:hypothetical protein
LDSFNEARMAELRRYFVLIKFGGSTPIRDRVQKSAPAVLEILKDIGRNDIQLAITSDNGDSFGFLLRAPAARVIRSRLESPGKGKPWDAVPDGGSPLRNEDSVLVLEVGEDFDGRGFSKGWTWLQHRPT